MKTVSSSSPSSAFANASSLSSKMPDRSKSSDTSPDIVRLLAKLWHKMQPVNGARRCIYCGPDVLEALDHIARTTATGHALGKMEWQGEEVLSFRGAPFRRVDQFSLAEAAVS